MTTRKPIAILLLIILLFSGGMIDQTETPISAEETDSSPIYFPYISHDPYVEPCGDRPTTPMKLPAVYAPGFTFSVSAAAAQLQAQGQTLATHNIGFHASVGGNRTGISDYFAALNTAQIPIVIKSADDFGVLKEVLDLPGSAAIEHVLIFRATIDKNGFDSDVPNYTLSPQQAAQEHWEYHKGLFPPEFKNNPDYKSRVWVETINEVDKNRSEWLAQFALATAQLAMADGYKWAAFGWSSGEPEIEHWKGEQMRAFLEFAAAHPDRVAVALHEYSYTTGDIKNIYPYLVGRFQALFEVADEYCIARPTVLITEWGWEYQDVPNTDQAIQDIAWASQLYAAYPEVKGATIWYLGAGYGEIANQAQRLIGPSQIVSTQTYHGIYPAGVVNPALFGPVSDPLWATQTVEQLRQAGGDFVEREATISSVGPQDAGVEGSE